MTTIAPHRFLRRALTVAAIAVVFVLLADPALAADSESGSSRGGALSWIEVTDSGGVQIWRYALDLDDGGITSVGKLIWAALANLIFVVGYKTFAALAVWFIDWVLSLTWFDVLTSPVVALGNGMQHLVDQLGVELALLTATALIAVFWLARGMWARGIYELGASAIIFALAAGVFANPVQLIAGPDGAVYQANALGLEVSHALQEGGATGKDVTLDELRQEQSARLADVFISDPFQVVNFGTVLSPKCQKIYAAEMKKREPNADSEIRDQVKDCDKAAGEWAENPSPEMVMSAAVFLPSAVVVLVLALLLGAALLVAGFTALFLSIKLIWDLLQALGPSGLRVSLWSSTAEVVMALAMVVFSSAFLGGLLTFVEFVFTAGSKNGDSAVKTFAVVDVVLVTGTIVFWRWRQKIKDAAQRLAQGLATRPGGAPAVPPRPGMLAPMAQNAMRAASLVQLHRIGSNVGSPPAAVPAGDGEPSADRPPRGANAEFIQPQQTPQPGSGAGVGAATTTQQPRSALQTAARKRLVSGGLHTSADQSPSPGPSPLGTAAVAVAGALTGGGGAGVVKVAQIAAQKRPASASTPRRAALEARITNPTPTAPPPPASFDRVVRGGQVIYVPKTASRA